MSACCDRGSPETIYKVCPISIYDVAAVETWLEDLAREGWCPVGFPGGRVELRPDAPMESRFRLQPLRGKKETLDPEREAVCRAMGWRLVGRLSGVFWVWRCDDPDAPELDTDPVVQGEGYRYLRRRMIRRTAGWVVVWLALLAGSVWMAANLSLREMLYRGSWLSSLLQPLLGAVLLVLILVEIWLDARNTWRLWKTLTAGVPLERPKPYRRQRLLGQASYGITLVILVLNIVVNFQNLNPVRFGWEHTRDILENGQPPAEAVTVHLADLDGVESHWFSAEEKTLPIAPEMYATRQYGELPGVGQVSAETDYYRLRTAGLARRLAEELTEERIGSWLTQPQPLLEELDAAGLDGFWWAAESGDVSPASQYAVLLRGQEVLAVRYHGPRDLRGAVPYLASLLGD